MSAGRNEAQHVSRVQDDLTAAQGANLLYQQVRTTGKVSFKTESAISGIPARLWPLKLF
jgi:hypothetical protein